MYNRVYHDHLLAYGSHEIRSAYLIDINMILHTVFKVFVNLKIGCDTKSRQQKKKGRSNAGVVSFTNPPVLTWHRPIFNVVDRPGVPTTTTCMHKYWAPTVVNATPLRLCASMGCWAADCPLNTGLFCPVPFSNTDEKSYSLDSWFLNYHLVYLLRPCDHNFW